MDKIKELIKGIGATNELADDICEEMERWKEAVRKNLKEEYEKKAELAKQLCLEEVDKEKIRLSRRLKIYLESKANSMAEAAARQYAIEEAESACTLRRVKGLVEDINIDDSGVSRKLQEAQKTAIRLERANQSLREEKTAAIAKANRSYGIAQDLIKKTRELETKIVEGKGPCSKCKEFGCEGECAGGSGKCSCPKGECTCESRKRRGKKTVSESKKRRLPRTRRVDEGRKRSGKTRSTRPTLVESQVAAPRLGGSNEASVISKIAHEMPED